MTSSWLVRPPWAKRAGFQLYLFPAAGGSAGNFAEWHARLRPAIDTCAIQLPGHGTRCFEEPYKDLDRVASEVVREIVSDLRGPFGLYGHSLGGLLSFEVARKMQALAKSPRVLVVSGCDPPRVERETSKLSHLSDDALIERLREFDGTPIELLDDEWFVQSMLPTIRADFEMAGNYRYREAAQPLDADLEILTGREDVHAPPARASGWAAETRGRMRHHEFEGGHFFQNANLPRVWSLIASAACDFEQADAGAPG